MKRRLFNLAAAVSLLLCVATLALWVRSYWHGDSLHRVSITQTEFSQQAISSHAGVMNVDLLRYPDARPELTGRRHSFWRIWASEPNVALASFDYSQNDSLLRFGFPHWLAAILFAILPALHLRALIRSRRLHGAGRCRDCGYDLRATPERCPECGAVPAVK